MSTHYAIVQQLNATKQFGGVDPGTVAFIMDLLKIFPTADIGGLIDPDHRVPILPTIFGSGGGAATDWTVSYYHAPTSTELVVYQVANLDSIEVRHLPPLPVNWTIKIVTTGAATAMKLWCSLKKASDADIYGAR